MKQLFLCQLLVAALLLRTLASAKNSSPTRSLVPAKKEALSVPKLVASTPDVAPNNVMTDENLKEAVEIWCNNPTQAARFFGPISQWNTTAVTNFRGLFRRKSRFNDDISQWDTSRATSMAAMFEECHAFDQDLSAWDTG